MSSPPPCKTCRHWKPSVRAGGFFNAYYSPERFGKCEELEKEFPESFYCGLHEERNDED